MFALLIALAGLTITSGELSEVRKVAAVCRAAAEVAERSGDSMDAIDFLRKSAEAGGLSLDERSLLIRMCGVYSAGVSDTARKELKEALRRLDQNTEEFRKMQSQ